MANSNGPFNTLGNPRIVASDRGVHVGHPSNGAIVGYYRTRADAERAVALHEAAPELLAAARTIRDEIRALPESERSMHDQHVAYTLDQVIIKAGG